METSAMETSPASAAAAAAAAPPAPPADDALKPSTSLPNISDAMRAAQEAAEKEMDEQEALEAQASLKSPRKAPTAVPALLKAAGVTSAEEAPADSAHEKKIAQLNALIQKASQYSTFIVDTQQDAEAKIGDGAVVDGEDATEEGQKRRKKRLKKEEKQQKKEKKKQLKNGGGAAAAAADDNDEEPAGKKMKVADGGAVVTASAAAATATATATAEAAESEEPAPFTQPRNLTGGELKNYQLEGLRWMATLFENGLSGVLADEMGLGKTIQIISFVAYLELKNVYGPFIVAAPLATLPNWVKEFKKWLPTKNVILYHGSKAERAAMRAGPTMYEDENGEMQKRPAGPLYGDRKKGRECDYRDFPVIITSYEMCIIDRSELAGHTWKYMFVDEGQRVKNRNCKLVTELKKFDTESRILLSGTPIQNTLEELWSLLNFVNPAIFDDLDLFQSWFGFSNIGARSEGATSEADIVAQEERDQIVSKLHEILRPFLLRRLKKDVLIDMPDKKEIIVYAPMSPSQQQIENLIATGKLREKLVEWKFARANELTVNNPLMQRRKNCNHPFLFGEPIDTATGKYVGEANPAALIHVSGKFALLDRLLVHLKANDHRVLIFSQMTELLNILEDYLQYRQWKYCRIDGDVKIHDRQARIESYNEPGSDIFVFMLSTRAGGLGVNLQTADTCILFDSDWNPHADSQAMDRCHRIGQTKNVCVYRLLTQGSVEIEMMEKQISKKKLERMAISGGGFSKVGSRAGKSLDAETLKNLLKADVGSMELRLGATDKSSHISDAEFELITNRSKIFGATGIPKDGTMYDLVEPNVSGDLINAAAGLKD